MVRVIGGNIRNITRMDMGLFSRLKETFTLGNSSRMTITGMEYADGQMEQYIMGNTNATKEMVMAIIDFQMEMNITDNIRMIRG
jgi:hypothetical protein